MRGVSGARPPLPPNVNVKCMTSRPPSHVRGDVEASPIPFFPRCQRTWEQNCPQLAESRMFGGSLAVPPSRPPRLKCLSVFLGLTRQMASSSLSTSPPSAASSAMNVATSAILGGDPSSNPAAATGAAILKQGWLQKRGEPLSATHRVGMPQSFRAVASLDSPNASTTLSPNLTVFFAGEHIKTWRPRYFILKNDGQFLGFKNKPSLDTDLTDPLNNFTVRNCEIIESNRPKPFTFAIRGLQMTTVVVRTFHVDSEEDRYLALLLTLFIPSILSMHNWQARSKRIVLGLAPKVRYRIPVFHPAKKRYLVLGNPRSHMLVLAKLHSSDFKFCKG